MQAIQELGHLTNYEKIRLFRAGRQIKLTKPNKINDEIIIKSGETIQIHLDDAFSSNQLKGGSSSKRTVSQTTTIHTARSENCHLSTGNSQLIIQKQEDHTQNISLLRTSNLIA